MSTTYKKLEDVCEILDSQRIPITAKDRKAGLYPYYGANGLQDYVAEYIFDDELVLLAEDGGNFGSADRPIAYRVSGKCWVNNHAHVLKAKPCIDIDYLCYSLMFYDTNGLVNGATRQKLTQAAMREMKIPYRNNDEQKEIVRKIDGVFSLIEKGKLELSYLDQLVKSRFVEMFGDEITNSCEKEQVTIGEACTLINGRAFKPTEWSREGLPIVRIQNLNDINAPFNYFDGKVNDQHLINSGMLLFSWSGTPGTSFGAFMWNRGLGVLNQHIFKVIPKLDFDLDYLRYAINGQLTAIIAKAHGGVGLQHITKAELEKIVLLQPSMQEQKQFAAFVAEVDKSKLAVKQSLEKLETLKKSLMQQYFG